MISAGNRCVRSCEGSAQISRKSKACIDDFGSQRDKFVVPHIEGAETFAADAAGTSGFQQRCALFEDPVIVAQHCRHAWCALYEQLIRKTTT